MQIVINISEEDLDAIKELKSNGYASRHELRILNGIRLPKGHGRLIDADKLFPDRNTEKGLAISQSQIANAETIESQRWIPCNERLPKDDEDVLVQMTDYSMMVDFRTASSSGWFWAEKDDLPIAWMPLPQPYKAESEE